MQYETKIKKLPKSEVELTASIPATLLDEARKKAIKNLSASLEIPGFRKGFVPEKVVLEKVGEGEILEEAADLLLKEHFPKMIEEAGNLDIIGRPQISIQKLALGNPLEIKAIFAIMPEFELPDYKKIADEVKTKEKSKEKEPEATEKEIDEVLLQIRKNKAHFDWHQKNPDVHHHDHGDIKDEDLPALTDEFAKEAGNFQNLAELKEKVKENIITEKKQRNNEKRRALIIEKLIKNTQIDLPEILIESEIQKSVAQMKDDIARMGGKWDEYLTHIKKTEDDLKKESKESSENKAKIQLIFNKIAEAEKIIPDQTILDNEVKQIMEHYQGANEESARIYVSTILNNQAVLKLLEV